MDTSVLRYHEAAKPAAHHFHLSEPTVPSKLRSMGQMVQFRDVTRVLKLMAYAGAQMDPQPLLSVKMRAYSILTCEVLSCLCCDPELTLFFHQALRAIYPQHSMRTK